MGHSVHLAVPEARPPSENDFDTRRRAVEHWLENLPVANLGETSRTVFETVRQVNRQTLPAGRRLEFLDQVGEIVTYIVEGLRKHYVGRELPLRRKPRKVAALATVLLQEMALGHEVAVETDGSDRLGQRARAGAIAHALQYRGQVLLENWLVYQSGPTDGWRRIHGLYALALEAGVADQGVKFPEVEGRPRRVTPAGLYKQINLTAAANPLCLPAGEVLEVWRLLGGWSDAARLVDPGEPGSDEAVFRVPRQEDGGPRVSVPERDRPDDRLLVTTPLVEVVERELSRTGRAPAFWRRRRAATADPALSRRLLLALAAVSRRQHRRVRTSARVAAVVGLARIHRTLSEAAGLPRFTSDAADHSFQARDTSDGREREDVWDLLYPSEFMRALRAEQARAASPSQQSDDHEAPDDWSLVNLSAGGYCLISDPSRTHRAQVGELILLREMAGRNLPWQLGCIRWLRSVPDQGLQVGLQVLGYSPAPVQLRAEHADGRVGPTEHGFMLPAIEATEQPATLITPGPHYEAGRRARLRFGHRETSLVLDRERDSTGHFAQFDFRHSDPLTEDESLSGLFSAE